ncbi:MAG: hypothetical protein CL878_08075 [Dehalococcoidia bacterium]|nr:hypothetical protein [Dehalococcoidia bacterium]
MSGTTGQRDRQMPGMTIGVMGSAGGDITAEVREQAYRLGEEIARRGLVLLTGACPGIPQESVKGASAHGGLVVGISPALDFAEHVQRYHSPTRGYNAIVYTGSGLMGREIENIRSSDAVVFISGRVGTLGEFAIAYDEGNIIGLLRGSGGITDHLPEIIQKLAKRTRAIVCIDDDPIGLLDQLEKVYRERERPQQLKLLTQHNPDGVEEGNGGQADAVQGQPA